MTRMVVEPVELVADGGADGDGIKSVHDGGNDICWEVLCYSKAAPGRWRVVLGRPLSRRCKARSVVWRGLGSPVFLLEISVVVLLTADHARLLLPSVYLRPFARCLYDCARRARSTLCEQPEGTCYLVTCLQRGAARCQRSAVSRVTVLPSLLSFFYRPKTTRSDQHHCECD